jgi:alkylation response protein AidB-like acyl-CoA dehydrogenase
MTASPEARTQACDYPEGARELARAAAQEIAPHAAAIDAAGEFSWDIVDVFRRHRLFALAFTSDYGGSGARPSDFLAAIEEVAAVCGTSALTLSMQQLGSLPIKLAGSEEQRRRWLPPLACGEWLGAYALTERGAGSDPAALTTRARRDGDSYLISGAKKFISNAGIAAIYTVFARTSEDRHRGISAFVVPADSPGFEVGQIEDKMGLRGQPTGELFFDHCRVPVANRLGDEGSGFALAMRVLDRSRPGIAAQALGLAEGAKRYALEYAKARETFGTPIVNHQLVAAMLADMETKCRAARALLADCAQALDEGSDGPRLTTIASIAKMFCSDVAMEVTAAAVQILGGYGYIRDHPVERMMRDAKVTQIYEGTNEIQRLVIARQLAATARPS